MKKHFGITEQQSQQYGEKMINLFFVCNGNCCVFAEKVFSDSDENFKLFCLSVAMPKFFDGFIKDVYEQQRMDRDG